MARREERGVFHQLVRELAVEDVGRYRDFFRVNSQQFEFLFNAVSHTISKQDTKLRSSIKPAERLACCHAEIFGKVNIICHNNDCIMFNKLWYHKVALI